MLLRFGVSNYRSISDYQELLLAASPIKEHQVYVISVNGLDSKILPAIGIYGANASGKSNVLQAFAFMRLMLLKSHANGSATGGIARIPFQLDPEVLKQPSHFDCDVLIDNVRYHYGFVVDDDRVREEWLYAYPSKHRQVWFHRKYNEEPSFYFGKFLKGKNKTIEALTRDNSLFLSAAAQNNHKQLSKIYRYFEENYFFRLNAEHGFEHLETAYLDKGMIKTRIIEFLKRADTGIVEAQVEKREGTVTDKSIIENIRTALGSENASVNDTLRFGHQSLGFNSIFLKLGDESRGTLQLLTLLGPLFEALESGKVIIIDELDTSLHSLLSLQLLKLFNSPSSNKGGAQLIFTTHDTNLLGGEGLLCSQIWLTEKDKKGATHLYPLTDIRTRHTDNFETGYLQGYFGGIPFLGGLDVLKDGQKAENL
jgi:AAA15 family ATPase/GTPase